LQSLLYLHESIAMAKRKLISEPATYPDLTIIGLSSQLRDYRLAFFLNRDIGINLVKIKDLPVYSEKEDTLFEFPLYTSYEPARRLNYYLMGNNNAGNRMIPAYKQADFMLMIKGQIDNERSGLLNTGIRKIPGVQMVFNLEIDKIKNLEGIMTDLELHLARK
jgi:hypothetical protein